MGYELLTMSGVDIDELIKRLMGNEKLISMFIRKFLEDKNFEKLVKAFADKDMKGAEDASHTLKGMCGNLSLKQLFGLFSQQVVFIRAGEMDKAENMMAQINEEYEKAVSFMKMWLEQV